MKFGFRDGDDPAAHLGEHDDSETPTGTAQRPNSRHGARLGVEDEVADVDEAADRGDHAERDAERAFKAGPPAGRRGSPAASASAGACARGLAARLDLNGPERLGDLTSEDDRLPLGRATSPWRRRR